MLYVICHNIRSRENTGSIFRTSDAFGVDTFDCVAPTREARNGTLYVKNGRISIQKAEYREDFSPIEEGCDCYTCKNFTRTYLWHLAREKELLFYRLASIHNLYFTNNCVREIRERIKRGEV